MPRQQKMVHVLEIDSNELPDRLDEVAAVFQNAWDETPEEYREHMSFYTWGRSFYDSPYVTFEAYYLRDETDEEMADRENREAREKAAHEQKEKLILADLKAKYEAN